MISVGIDVSKGKSTVCMSFWIMLLIKDPESAKPNSPSTIQNSVNMVK